MKRLDDRAGFGPNYRNSSRKTAGQDQIGDDIMSIIYIG